MSTYPWRMNIFVTAAQRDEANQLAAQLDPDGGEGTFSVPCSATASEPASHYACSTVATNEMRQQMEQAISGFAGATYYILSADDDRLVASNSSTAPINEEWGWVQSLSDIGLKRIMPPVPR